MPSGFLVLPDGRCFARRWRAYDAVLRAVADQLTKEPLAQSLHLWLLEQLPGPNDEEEIGYGAWARAKDGEVIVRHLDLRLMTSENQRYFCEAVKRASLAIHAEDLLNECLADLADMVDRFESGEPPLSKSDWRKVLPPEGELIGPDWRDKKGASSSR